jgi:hypothetical protein
MANKVMYNVNVSIMKSVEQEWLDWMLKKHIPEVMATGSFLEHRVCRLTSHEPEEGFSTYIIQYLCAGQAILDHYSATHAPALQADHQRLFEGRFVAFRSVMEVIEL